MKRQIVNVVSGALGLVAGASAAGKVLGKKVSIMSELSDKHLALYMLMNQWVQVKQEGKSLVSYFEANEYTNIAIYGMNYVGQTLYRELENSLITIKYAIDQNAENIYADCEVLTMEDDLENVDAVIVTPIYYFDEIERKLREKVDCPIISVEDIVYEV